MGRRAAETAVHDAETLAAVIDAQRAEQRNAESRLSRLWEMRDGERSQGAEHGPAQVEAIDREIAAVTARVKQALKLQGELMIRLGQTTEGGSDPAAA